MDKEGIHIRENQVEMIVKGVPVSVAKLDDVVKLYLVNQEHPLFHGDEPFYVTEFQEFLWVIPYFTLEVDRFIRIVARKLGNRGAVLRVISPRLPLVWRKLSMGVVPLFPIPRLARHPLTTLPKWRSVEPFSPAEFLHLCEGNEDG